MSINDFLSPPKIAVAAVGLALFVSPSAPAIATVVDNTPAYSASGMEIFPVDRYLPNGAEVRFKIKYMDLDRTPGKTKMWDGSDGMSGGESYVDDQSHGMRIEFLNAKGTAVPIIASMDANVENYFGSYPQEIPYGSSTHGVIISNGQVAIIYDGMDKIVHHPTGQVTMGEPVGYIVSDPEKKRALTFNARKTFKGPGFKRDVQWDHYAAVDGSLIEGEYKNTESLTLRQNCFEFLSNIKNGIQECIGRVYNNGRDLGFRLYVPIINTTIGETIPPIQ